MRSPRSVGRGRRGRRRPARRPPRRRRARRRAGPRRRRRCARRGPRAAGAARRRLPDRLGRGVVRRAAPSARASASARAAASSGSRAAATVAAIRAVSGRSPSRLSASQAAADPTVVSRSVSVGHSLCQAPAARSCSCSIAAKSVAASPGARRAQARAEIAATGLFLCGIADEPPRAPPSLTSATSVCASSTTSTATVATTPATAPSTPARSAIGRRTVCQGSGGVGEAQFRRERRPQRDTGAATGGERARRTAVLHGERGHHLGQPQARAVEPGQPPAAFSPKVVGSACCIRVRPMTTSSRCAGGQAGGRLGRRREVAVDRADRVAGEQHQGGVQDVLAGRPDVDGDRVPRPPTASCSTRTSGGTGLPSSAALAMTVARSSRPGRRRPRSPRRPRWSARGPGRRPRAPAPPRPPAGPGTTPRR